MDSAAGSTASTRRSYLPRRVPPVPGVPPAVCYPAVMRRLLPDPDDLDDDGLAAAYRVPAGRHLRVNFIAALDGAISVEGRSGGLGSPGDRRGFQSLRALCDAVLVGAGTAAAEGYRPITQGSPLGLLRAR